MCKHVLGTQKVPVIPDVLEQVKCLLESVGLIVLSEHHVITAAGYHENDGGHVCNRKEKDFSIHSEPAMQTIHHKLALITTRA